jgi:hypothetical protein
MRPILSEDDLAIALSAERAVIYFFVEWSVYAVQGRQRFGELELLYGCEPEMSFWVADVSDVEAPAAYIADWLKTHDRKEVFLAAGMGNGPIIWLKGGAIVDAVRSAINCDLHELRTRTDLVRSK